MAYKKLSYLSIYKDDFEDFYIKILILLNCLVNIRGNEVFQHEGHILDVKTELISGWMLMKECMATAINTRNHGTGGRSMYFSFLE